MGSEISVAGYEYQKFRDLLLILLYFYNTTLIPQIFIFHFIKGEGQTGLSSFLTIRCELYLLLMF